MILLFSLIAICSIWVLGLKIVTSGGMIFGRIGEYAEKKLYDEGRIIFAPLLVCEWCMPSIHTAIAFLFAYFIGVIDHFSVRLLAYYPLVVMGSSLVCGLVWQYYEDKKAESIFNKINETEPEDIDDGFRNMLLDMMEAEDEHKNTLN